MHPAKAFCLSLSLLVFLSAIHANPSLGQIKLNSQKHVAGPLYYAKDLKDKIIAVANFNHDDAGKALLLALKDARAHDIKSIRVFAASTHKGHLNNVWKYISGIKVYEDKDGVSIYQGATLKVPIGQIYLFDKSGKFRGATTTENVVKAVGDLLAGKDPMKRKAAGSLSDVLAFESPIKKLSSTYLRKRHVLVYRFKFDDQASRDQMSKHVKALKELNRRKISIVLIAGKVEDEKALRRWLSRDLRLPVNCGLYLDVAIKLPGDKTYELKHDELCVLAPDGKLVFSGKFEEQREKIEKLLADEK